MSSFINNRINYTNPATRTENMGGVIRFGEPAVLDQNTSWNGYFKFIMVTVAGNVAFENEEGNSVILPAVQPGFGVWAVGRKILSAGTTATGVFVYTGD